MKQTKITIEIHCEYDSLEDMIMQYIIAHEKLSQPDVLAKIFQSTKDEIFIRIVALHENT
jgi:hypothetical protein